MSRDDQGRRVAEKNRRRAAYALAAGAATGAVMSGECDAAIQYFTGDINVPQGIKQPLDFNLDGYTDVTLKNYVFTNGNYQGATVNFFPGKLVGFISGLSYVSALAAGTMIDSTNVGPDFKGSMAYGTVNPNAQFKNVTNAYVGFAFPIGPTNVYNAWVRVDVDNTAGTFFIHDWAYEDALGVGIRAGDTGPVATLGDFNADTRVDGADVLVWQQGLGTTYNASDLGDWKTNFGVGYATSVASAAPEPGTLGMLAAGAAGLGLLRRRRRS